MINSNVDVGLERERVKCSAVEGHKREAHTGCFSGGFPWGYWTQSFYYCLYHTTGQCLC